MRNSFVWNVFQVAKKNEYTILYDGISLRNYYVGHLMDRDSLEIPYKYKYLIK